MMTNKNNSQFWFEFPKGFLDENLDKLFLNTLKRQPLHFDSTLKYLNSTIQSISIPGFNLETSSQILNKEPIEWKSGGFLHRNIEKEINVTLSLINGSLNWLVLFLNTEVFLKSEKSFHPDFYIRILDNSNYELFSIRLSQVQIIELPSQNFSWTENTFDSKSFDIKFKFNQLEIKFNID